MRLSTRRRVRQRRVKRLSDDSMGTGTDTDGVGINLRIKVLCK